MPKQPSIADQLASVDQVTVKTAKRLDRHITNSAAHRRDIRARIKEIKLRLEELERQVRRGS